MEEEGEVKPENMSYIVIPLDQLLIRPGLKLVKSEIGSCLIWKRLSVDLLLIRVCNNQGSTNGEGGHEQYLIIIITTHTIRQKTYELLASKS